MKISNGDSSHHVNQDSYASGEDASVSQEDTESSVDKSGASSAPSQDTSQADRAKKLPIAPQPLDQRSAAAASTPSRSSGTDSARTAGSGRSSGTTSTAATLSRGATGTTPSTGGADITHSDTLPGATAAEFTDLLKEYDTGDHAAHKNSDRNMEVAKYMEFGVGLEMTGYPPDVVRFEKSQLDVRGLLVDLPLSQREFYGSALATLSAAYKLETDPKKRLAILEKALELDGVIRNASARAANDPVDRVLSIFQPPMGEGYLSLSGREDVDRLARLQEDFLDARDPAERKAIFKLAVEIKARLQQLIGIAVNVDQYGQLEQWEEANKEVDRILKEAEAQTDPAKRYELIGRQLFQITPGQDRLKDKVLLAFTQRMYTSAELRNKLNAWHIQVTSPLNAHGVGGPKRYTDILGKLPPVSDDYVRDLSDLYTDVLSDTSHRNHSITPKVRAARLATQILEGVMRVMLEMTPIGFLADQIPSTLPDNVRMGLEFGGMMLDLITGAGVGKQVGRGAKALAAAARKTELDNLAGKVVRAGGKGLVDDASERIARETLADERLSPEAKATAQVLERKALVETGPAVDPVSELAHEAVGINSYGSLATYADPHVVPGSLRRGAQPGILEDSKGDRYIELGGKAYRVRFDRDNDTWRVFDPAASWRPQYPVRLNEKTNTWEVHGDVGLMGGKPKISDGVVQEIVRLLKEGDMSQQQIATRMGVSMAFVRNTASDYSIRQSAPGSVRNQPIPPATREAAIRLLREGDLSRSDIAARLGISRAFVSTLAKSNNIAVLANTISPEIRLQVEKLLAEGSLSTTEIGRKVGISANSVLNIRSGMKSLPAHRWHRKITAAVRADIIRQLTEGASQREVARANGVSRNSVWRIARQERLPVKVLRAPATPEQIDQVFALRGQGKTIRVVASTVGLSETTVKDICANVNADTYKRSWWDTTPEKRTAVLRQLDQGKAAKEIAKEQGLPVETVRGIANQQRMARDSLASELLREGQSFIEVGDKLGIPPEYVLRLRHKVPPGTHDIHDIQLNSADGAVAEDMFKKGYTREDVAEKLGISLWKAHSLANEYRSKTMDSVMPKQLADLVAALDDQDRTFTTGELARATGLPETTVMVVEREYEMGSIVSHAASPQPGPSHGTASVGVSYEWIRPLTAEQEGQAIRALDDGQRLKQVADGLHVDVAAVERLYEQDLPLVAPADDPIDPLPAAAPAPTTPSTTTPPPATVVLSEADKIEIRKLARDDQLSPEFIANLFEIPLDEVKKVLA
ncbi:helix-turn-helix domain-containing protein [Paraburkholderia phytofirmans]|uniref:Transposase IS204/IS1001/IS1096/IS1165 helix-turn-helix domain-containing protein n=1 Tax=Paraburkholderia phytofirmans (strain DSM 17436 / LMG 22146 / PsJN) TaxID=398527 RepID=B2TCZ0_PARPJ|nr:helix-turn-helix domain-containing protein [Paraburkholderia phytofirmans]ACD19564.1 conserved hypothetical protein [Paraburkholderia phytofirmans PsJN]